MPVTPDIRIQAEDFDAASEVRKLTGGRTDIGAVVTFTGLCRDEGDTLAALESGWGHRDLGVYATVTRGGEIALGDPVEILP